MDGLRLSSGLKVCLLSPTHVIMARVIITPGLALDRASSKPKVFRCVTSNTANRVFFPSCLFLCSKDREKYKKALLYYYLCSSLKCQESQRTLPLPPIHPGEDKDPQMTHVFAHDPSNALYENVEVDEGGLPVLLLYLEMLQEALGENAAQYHSNFAFELTVRDEIAGCKSYMKALERV
jgi:hypothetical protein